MQAVITGWGFYVPPKVLTNADLEAMVNTSDAWIFERTGIRERHIVEGDEVTSGMATKAAKQALARAKVRAVDLEASAAGAGIQSTALHGDGRQKKHLRLEGGGALHPASRRDDLASDFIQMNGPEVFKLAVPAMADAAKEALAQAGLRLEDV